MRGLQTRRKDGYTQKQFDLIDFCWEFLDKQGFSPSLAHIAEGTGYHPGNIGTTLQVLAMRDHCLTIMRSETGLAVVGVNHPTKGDIWLEETFYDEELGASYFAKDFLELPTRIERHCLACRTKFETRSKFVRLCNGCRETADELTTAPVGGYVSNLLAISMPSNGIGRFEKGTK